MMKIIPTNRVMFCFYAAGLLFTLSALALSVFYRPAFWFVFPFANGLAIGLFACEVTDLLARAKTHKMMERLPANVQMLERSDDKLVVAVTRNNGEALIVDLPADYDPRVDNAETLMRIVNPELFEEE